MAVKTAKYKKQTRKKSNSRNKLFGFRWLAVLGIFVFAAVGTYMTLFSKAGVDFTKVAVHPQAAAQPTAWGKTIASLKSWNGKLYAGYGDYNANTGPIAISAFDGSVFSAVPEITSQTEAVWQWRVLNNALYAPSTDPTGGSNSDYTEGKTSTGTTSWINPRRVGFTHAYDMATTNGTDLWIVGSQGYNAVAYMSVDGGQTWQSKLSIAPQISTNYARFYGAIVLGGKLYVHAVDSNNVAHQKSKVYDPSSDSWSDGPSLGIFNNAQEFAGKAVMHSSFHSGTFSGGIKTFDGSRTGGACGCSVYDYTIDGSNMYVLTTDNRVLRSTDLSSWNQVGTAPTVARSIAVYNGTIYVGGTDSALYRHTPSEPGPDEGGTGGGDSVLPQVSIVQPGNGTNITTSPTMIDATSTDDVTVVKTELFINGKRAARSTTGSINYSWNTRKLKSGQYKIEVKAYDRSGNVGTASVTVTK